MARFIELKYEGKEYKEQYDIINILLKNKFNWFLDCEVENLRIEILKNTLIINAGIFYNGSFEYGVIRDVDWRSGIFENGVIYNGIFKYVEIKKGIIFNGTFLNGQILAGDIRNGKFVNMDISSECKIDNSIKNTFLKTFESFVKKYK